MGVEPKMRDVAEDWIRLEQCSNRIQTSSIKDNQFLRYTEQSKEVSKGRMRKESEANA